jgi:hypothetical protein
MTPTPLRMLRRFVPRAAGERCHLCGAVLVPGHPHLLENSTLRLVCACEPCALLFERRGVTSYRRVERQVRQLANFQMLDAEWEQLGIPIGLAFFVYREKPPQVMAVYPGPAGLTHSQIPPGSWSRIAAANKTLGKMQPEVEALLVNRMGGLREYYVVSIEHCYELAGLIRVHWRGLSGGDKVWLAIREFFCGLKEASHA